MGGSTDDEQSKNLDKIIRNIAKEVIIDKNIWIGEFNIYKKSI